MNKLKEIVPEVAVVTLSSGKKLRKQSETDLLHRLSGPRNKNEKK